MLILLPVKTSRWRCSEAGWSDCWRCTHDCGQCDRLAGGLQKIADASEMLAVLNEKLAVQKVAVTEKTAACEALLEEIAAGTKQASEKKVVAEAKGKEIEEQSVIIVKEKVGSVWLSSVMI